MTPSLTRYPDREEATKEGDFTLNDDDEDDEEDVEEWDGEVEAVWANDGDDAEDVKDESAAYLEFLKEEVDSLTRTQSWSALTLGLVRKVRGWPRRL